VVGLGIAIKASVRGDEHVAAILGRRRCEFTKHRNPRTNNNNGGAGRAGHEHEAAVLLSKHAQPRQSPDGQNADGDVISN
jgi:hypothetical protein